jgi:putative flippase GtrA
MLRGIYNFGECTLRRVDLHEFSRFFVTGILATIGNLTAVWISSQIISYSLALQAGLVVGFAISFSLGKFFAFRSNCIRRAPAELARFTLVYAIGASLYWVIAMIVGIHIAPRLLPAREAGLVGAFVGASAMVITSYLGHRHFTYADRKKP